jgi:AraC family transcriptional regulator
LAATTLRLAQRYPQSTRAKPPSVLAHVTRAVRLIEHNLHREIGLNPLASETGLSPYHFLRTFTRLAGLTPHQHVRRARLWRVATELTAQPKRVLDIALDSGFGDMPNFNRAFRTEFGISPRRYRELIHQR